MHEKENPTGVRAILDTQKGHFGLGIKEVARNGDESQACDAHI